MRRPYSLAKASFMGETPTTRASLLVRIRDGNDGEAWSRFVEVYGPLVYDYGRRHGLAGRGRRRPDAGGAPGGRGRGGSGSPTTRARARSGAGCSPWHGPSGSTSRERLARQPRGSGDSTVADRLEAVPNAATTPRRPSGTRAYRQRLFDWAAAADPGRVPGVDLAGVLADRRGGIDAPGTWPTTWGCRRARSTRPRAGCSPGSGSRSSRQRCDVDDL